MPNIEAQPEWANVREIGIELARGGPDGNMNEQAKALVARTELLKEEKANKTDIVQGQYRFATLALFNEKKATIPVNSTVIIDEAGDNQGTNTWDGTTLKKSAYDPIYASQQHTQLKITESIEGGNVYTQAISNEGYYINVDDLKIYDNNRQFQKSSIAIVRISPSTKYLVKNFNVRPGASILSESDTNLIYGNKQTMSVQKISDQADGFIIQTSADANYLLMNHIIDDYDNSNVEIIQIGDIKINDVPVISKDKINKIEEYGLNRQSNLHVNTQYVEAKLIHIESGNLINNPNFMIGILSVEPGQKYNFKCDFYSPNGFVIGYRDTNNIQEGPTVGFHNLSTIKFLKDNSFDFVVPENVHYLFFNVLYVSNDGNAFDIRASVEVYKYEVSEKVRAIEGLELFDSTARMLIEESNASSSSLNKKKWLIIGDSISDFSFRPYPSYKNYAEQLKTIYPELEIYNYGISGTGFYSRYDVANTITQSESDIDFITIFWGTNDWGNIQYPRPNNKPLGQFGDNGTTTIAGCMNEVFSSLTEKFPRVPIYIFTPLPRFDAWGLNPPINEQGYRLTELVELLKKYANHYSIRVLDLYFESNFKCQSSAMKNIWTVNGDGVHPTLEAHQKLVPIIQSFFKSVI